MLKLAGPCLLAAMLLTVSAAPAQELKLPTLGEGGSGLFSAEQEHRLGRAWLRLFRAQAPILDDPLLQDYLETMVYKLVTHSQLEDRRVELVVVDNPVLNAFAVPGGIVGVHTGLLHYTQSEDELATVLAHELAHLSQRHFSRGVEQQHKQRPWSMAGLLAGLVLVATAGGPAGVAALSASQAAALESRLRFSRANEQEADRIGLRTVAEAGLDPRAAVAMFERMLAASRYASGAQVPEFLRTHPLSESRVSDARNRARQYPRRERAESLQFHLMRARVEAHHAASPQRAVAEFRAQLEGETLSREAALYGLALALIEAGRHREARREVERLLEFNPDRIEYIIAGADLDLAMGEARSAARALARVLRLYPGNYPLTMAYARALQQNSQAHIAEEVLLRQSRQRPGDPGLWYLLAEVSGLSGNIVGLHRARAEYFMLGGAFDEAERQLDYALGLARQDHRVADLVSQRLEDLRELRRQTRL